MQLSRGRGAYWAVHKVKLKKYARPRDWSVLIKRVRSWTVDRKQWTGGVGRPLINLKWKSNKGFYVLGSVVNGLVFGDQETGLESEETGCH